MDFITIEGHPAIQAAASTDIVRRRRADPRRPGFDLPAALNYIDPDRASLGPGGRRKPRVNNGVLSGGYRGEGAMEIATVSPVCSIAVGREACCPIEAAAMKNKDFDYDGLVRPMESRMMHSIWRIVRQREAAEDALQDALAGIWKKRDTVARHPNPQALILRISVDAAYDAVRKIRRRLRHEIPGLPDEAAHDSTPPLTTQSEDRNLRAAILEAIGGLPKRQATAMLLRSIEEQSYEEIARGMGCSETTVRIHVMRARAALARRLARHRPDLSAGLDGTGKEAVS